MIDQALTHSDLLELHCIDLEVALRKAIVALKDCQKAGHTLPCWSCKAAIDEGERLIERGMPRD